MHCADRHVPELRTTLIVSIGMMPTLQSISILLFTLLGSVLNGTAQEHPFVHRYQLTELSGAISIEWALSGGSTCDGQDVERSTDGLTFTPVHRIFGICGDPTVTIPFSWLDASPPEFSTVYYRLKFGFDGYSSVKQIVYDQLETSEQRFFPSPTLGEATLLLNVSVGGQVDLAIHAMNGRQVMEMRNLIGPRITLQLQDLQAGTYTYRAQSGDRSFTGRFVKL